MICTQGSSCAPKQLDESAVSREFDELKRRKDAQRAQKGILWKRIRILSYQSILLPERNSTVFEILFAFPEIHATL